MDWWLQAVIWLVAFVFLMIIELTTLALTTVWFAGGALVSFFLALFKVDVTTQLIVFCIVSVILMILLRPLARKTIMNRTQKTNVDSLVGKTAKVTAPVSNADGTGSVMLNGLEWTARAMNDWETFPEGTLVVVREIRGVKAMVERAGQSTAAKPAG